MKKFFLLLASGSIALTSVAQQRAMNFDQKDKMRTFKSSDFQRPQTQVTAKKGTAGGARWYNYNSYMNDMLTATVTQEINFAQLLVWNDTVHKANFTSGASNINMLSIGTIFDPSSVGFNNNDYYPGAMAVGPTDAYVVDSVAVFGVYKGNAAKASIVDTVRLSFVKGMGGAASSDDIFGGGLAGGGHYGAATFALMRHDSLQNGARSGATAVGTPNPLTTDILLVNTGAAPAWGDTSSNGIWGRSVALSSPISVSANGMVGMSITFKTGESIPPGTVVFDATTNTANNNTFMPIIGFASDAAGDEQWAPYYAAPDPKADSNVGLFKKMPGVNGWAGVYIPTWAWSSSGTTSGASYLQFPEVSFHVTCTTCGVVTAPPTVVGNVANINKVNAYPNPANNELNVPFTLDATADVTVTLSNLLGQVVATKSMNSVSKGTATFNTENLPAGLYNYAVISNGNRTTGRVVVAH